MASTAAFMRFSISFIAGLVVYAASFVQEIFE